MLLLQFNLAHTRWEIVFQPTYAAYLSLIESWWKTPRSPALKGRRFESWEAVCRAVEAATAYSNAPSAPIRVEPPTLAPAAPQKGHWSPSKSDLDLADAPPSS
jgi:hypothetical protein